MATKFENLTILLTDIVGYTDITSQSTRDESAGLLRDFNRLTQPVVSAFGGRRVKSLGDAILVTFKSPTDGVRCAMALQDAVHEHNRNQTGGGIPLHIRVALCLGEIRHDNGDVFGEPVNIAARIENITPADEIYLSGAVYLAMNKAEVPSEVVGKHTFKGIPDPVSVFRVPRFKLSRLVPTEESGDDPEKGFPFGGMHRQMPASQPANPMLQAVAGVGGFLKSGKSRTLWLSLAAVGVIGALALFGSSLLTGVTHLGTSWPLLKQAEGDIVAGNWAAVSRLAESALKDSPKNAEALLIKGHVTYLRDKKPGAAVSLYREALETEPDLKTETRTLAHLVAALQTVGQPAADVLARHPSPAATKQLAERAGKPGFAGRNKAAELLSQWGKQDMVDGNRRALLDLEDAPACSQRLQAVHKIREHKLKQALPALKKMTDVGFFNRLFANDPNACLLDDAKKTIVALEGSGK